MKDLKGTGLTDRLATAAAAKAALVAKLKPKPAVSDPNFANRAADQAAELKAVRAARAADKAAVVQARADEVATVAAEAQAVEDAALSDKREARKERKQLTKAEGKAKRDARYAARQARR